MLRERTSLKITKAVIFALILRELQGKFGKNRLGAFWFIFEPMAHVVVLIIIFSTLRARIIPGIDLAVFLVNGIVPFLLFRNITLKGMEAINSNRALFAYRQVKPFDMVISRAIVECLMMACVFLFLLFGMWWLFDFKVSFPEPINWLFTLGLGFCLSFGLALIFCVVIDVVPEAANIIRLLYLPLYFLSGVFFPIWLVPQNFLPILLLNPYLHLVELLRVNSISYYPLIHQINYFYPAAWAISVLTLGLALYRTNRLKLISV